MTYGIHTSRIGGNPGPSVWTGGISGPGEFAGLMTDPYTGVVSATFTQAMPEPKVVEERVMIRLGEPSRALETMTGESHLAPIPGGKGEIWNDGRAAFEGVQVPEAFTSAYVREQQAREAGRDTFFRREVTWDKDPVEAKPDGYIGDYQALRSVVDTQTILDNSEWDQTVDRMPNPSKYEEWSLAMNVGRPGGFMQPQFRVLAPTPRTVPHVGRDVASADALAGNMGNAGRVWIASEKEGTHRSDTMHGPGGYVPVGRDGGAVDVVAPGGGVNGGGVWTASGTDASLRLETWNQQGGGRRDLVGGAGVGALPHSMLLPTAPALKARGPQDTVWVAESGRGALGGGQGGTLEDSGVLVQSFQRMGVASEGFQKGASDTVWTEARHGRQDDAEEMGGAVQAGTMGRVGAAPVYRGAGDTTWTSAAQPTTFQGSEGDIGGAVLQGSMGRAGAAPVFGRAGDTTWASAPQPTTFQGSEGEMGGSAMAQSMQRSMGALGAPARGPTDTVWSQAPATLGGQVGSVLGNTWALSLLTGGMHGGGAPPAVRGPVDTQWTAQPQRYGDGVLSESGVGTGATPQVVPFTHSVAAKHAVQHAAMPAGRQGAPEQAAHLPMSTAGSMGGTGPDTRAASLVKEHAATAKTAGAKVVHIPEQLQTLVSSLVARQTRSGDQDVRWATAPLRSVGGEAMAQAGTGSLRSLPSASEQGSTLRALDGEARMFVDAAHGIGRSSGAGADLAGMGPVSTTLHMPAPGHADTRLDEHSTWGRTAGNSQVMGGLYEGGPGASRMVVGGTERLAPGERSGTQGFHGAHTVTRTRDHASDGMGMQRDSAGVTASVVPMGARGQGETFTDTTAARQWSGAEDVSMTSRGMDGAAAVITPRTDALAYLDTGTQAGAHLAGARARNDDYFEASKSMPAPPSESAFYRRPDAGADGRLFGIVADRQVAEGTVYTGALQPGFHDVVKRGDADMVTNQARVDRAAAYRELASRSHPSTFGEGAEWRHVTAPVKTDRPGLVSYNIGMVRHETDPVWGLASQAAINHAQRVEELKQEYPEGMPLDSVAADSDYASGLD